MNRRYVPILIQFFVKCKQKNHNNNNEVHHINDYLIAKQALNKMLF